MLELRTASLEELAGMLEVDISELYGLYLEFCRNTAANLVKAKNIAKISNWPQLEKIIVHIKEGSETFGLTELFKASEDLEFKLWKGQYETVMQQLDMLEHIFKNISGGVLHEFKRNMMKINIE